MNIVKISKKEIEFLYNVALSAKECNVFYLEQPEKSCGIGSQVSVRFKMEEGIAGFSTDYVVDITDVSSW